MNAMAAQAALDMQRVNSVWSQGDDMSRRVQMARKARKLTEATKAARYNKIMRECVAAVSVSSGASRKSLIGRDTSNGVPALRQNVMHMARERGVPFTVIGVYLDGRHHTTIMSGVDASQARLEAKESK